jgi:hypothetical protein
MSQADIDASVRLSRKQTADALSSAGYPIAEATLASMATRGGGPLFSKFGPRVVYRWADVIKWAQHRLSKPVRSTSELGSIASLREPEQKRDGRGGALLRSRSGGNGAAAALAKATPTG